MPSFTLQGVESVEGDSRSYSAGDFLRQSKAVLVAFICNHCPYARAIEDRLIALARAYSRDQLSVVGICSNDASQYPEDAPKALLLRWREKNYGFPYLLDTDQEAARAFGAVCTPDLFLFKSKDRVLYYHGRLDDNWKDPAAVTKHDLKEAIDGLLASKPPPREQHPSIGCSIKWKGEPKESL
ncbi:MAG: thioredoxin family protein [Myxococcota bacterium]